MDTNERIETRRLTQDAIVLYENAGKETLIREIADSTGRFVLNERCTFALDLNGIMVSKTKEEDTVPKYAFDVELSGIMRVEAEDVEQARRKIMAVNAVDDIEVEELGVRLTEFSVMDVVEIPFEIDGVEID
ncbi:MAG: hypothetical protein ACLQDI_05180 [Syntrophobacteraceae bacterium]